ncbi:MAG: PBP1A family penicillin-binding protein [Vulcanimicrobiota bacterium]
MSSKQREHLQRFFIALACVFVILVGGAGLFAAATIHALLKEVRRDLPKASQLAYFEPSQTTKIYASNGKLIATLYRENRTWMPLKKISPWMPKAALAIEDTNFYTHRGVDPKGILRALWAKFSKHDTQGASTITMQLARNIFLSADQTAERKLKETLLAIEIEKSFTKDEILEMYLNQIYLGSGAYGVQAASSLYFNKSCKDLSPAQSAVLAGLPQSPNEYSPLNHENKAKDRAKEVLGRMHAKEVGFLSDSQYAAALKELEAMKFYNKNRQEFQILEVPYFSTYVIKELYKRFDEDTLYRGGFKVYTTVDLDMQRKGEKIVKELVSRDAEYLNVHSAALVCIENKTGFIKTMVGGLGWTKKNQFNRAWQARRQPGSSFKPFVYATALESGLSPESVVPDTPITVDGYSPKNSDGRFMGAINLATALQNSRNVVSVRLIQLVGAKRVIYFAHAAGITEELPPFLSLALGACDVPPLQMASAYTVFPNAGLKIPSTPIALIKDAEGRIVEDNRVPVAKEVFSEPTATNMVDMMKRVVEAGTATNAYMEGHEVAGKTGTTDSFRDAWFNGYTAKYTTAVWVGNDDYSRMYTSFGGDLPARIWHEFMVFAMRNEKSSSIARNHTSKVCVMFCSETNERCGPDCPKFYRKFMYRNEVPSRYCGTHGAPHVTYTGVDTSHKEATKATPTKTNQGPAPTENTDAGPGPVPDQVQLPPPDAPPVDPGAPPPGDVPPPPPVDTSPPDAGPPPVPDSVPMDSAPPPPPPPEPVQP